MLVYKGSLTQKEHDAADVVTIESTTGLAISALRDLLYDIFSRADPSMMRRIKDDPLGVKDATVARFCSNKLQVEPDTLFYLSELPLGDISGTPHDQPAFEVFNIFAIREKQCQQVDDKRKFQPTVETKYILGDAESSKGFAPRVTIEERIKFRRQIAEKINKEHPESHLRQYNDEQAIDDMDMTYVEACMLDNVCGSGYSRSFPLDEFLKGLWCE